ncbi:MAG TPA: tRNA (adenosine(37)-N6)-threonylcarbamoyltransferase complex dimerization subunit type 1 TsaB [Candidatus Saccharimonadales bacterium]|nr:tRNA (adenosine(37)-N6)-threonylcarbamoyltransferase complex dimerization subunit type 1 TsaB [Candidatus Saccharimonadales bacterium]
MLLLTVRTDKPEAELGLFDGTTQVAYEVWHAHRELSVTILLKITDILQAQNKTLQDIDGIVTYAGPGSFTGLRIGLTVANTLAYSLDVPIVGITGEENWLQKGIAKLQADGGDALALPEYGRPVHITIQKK